MALGLKTLVLVVVAKRNTEFTVALQLAVFLPLAEIVELQFR